MIPSSEEYKEFRNVSGIKKNEIICSAMKNGHACSKSLDSSTDLSSVSSFTLYSESHRVHSDIKDIIVSKLNCRLYDVVQALKNFDKHRNGKILPTNLHNVLNIFCHPLTAKEFNELLQKEKLDKNGFINYKSFLENLTNKNLEVNNAFKNQKNEVREKDPNIEEIEVKMKQKICRNLKNFIRSMWLYDFNQDGLIQKHEFRNVLENYCFRLTDDQFNRLWSLYDPVGKGVLNYKDFLMKLGARTESYKRIMPKDSQIKINTCSPTLSVTNFSQEQAKKRCAKMGRDDPAIQGQVFSNVIEAFKKKIEKNFPVLLRTFQIKDSGGSGLIPLSVFHQVLNYFVMPMSSQLFKQVLMSFNVSPTTNKIHWYEFLKSVCMSNDAECQSDISYYTGSHSLNICKPLMEKLRMSGKDLDNFFVHSFTISAQNNRKTITRAELRRTINQSLTFPVTDEEFRALMFLLDPGHSNVIDCEKFLSLLRISPAEKSNRTSKQFSSEDLQIGNVFDQLSGEKLKKEFKKHFNTNLKNIEKAINAFDAEETGFMLLDDLKKILNSFCSPLSDSQCHEIFEKFPTISNKLFYSDFINFYKKGPYEDEEKWKLNVKKLTAAQDPAKKLSNDEILRHIREVVKAQKENFLEEFKNNDYCNAGIARKEVLLKLLNKYVLRLTDEQFNMLWNLLPINEIGFLKYEVFLNDFIEDYSIQLTCDKSNASSRGSSMISSQSTKKHFHSPNLLKDRPKTAGSISTSVSSNSFHKSMTRPKSAVSKQSWKQQGLLENEWNGEENKTSLVVQGQGCSVLTNEQYKQYRSFNFGNASAYSQKSTNCNPVKKQNSVDKNLKENDTNKLGSSYCDKKLFVEPVKSRWRDILRRCKSKDPDNINTIPWDDFISILPKTGIAINDDVLNLLAGEYNIKKGVPVNYWLFLKKILLALDHQSFGTNSKMAPTKEPVSLSKVLLSNRDKILKNYRDLRYAFRRADYQHSGCIKASDFRRILALHKIYLSEDDFFYICDYFDPKLTEQIHYDEFLEAFVRK